LSITRLLRDESGANLIEWGILVSLIAIVALIAVTTVGNETSEIFSEVGSGLAS